MVKGGVGGGNTITGLIYDYLHPWLPDAVRR